MRLNLAPWQPGLDVINAAISVALSTVVVVTVATGNATVSPVASAPTISQPAAGSGISGAAPGAIVGQAPPGSVVEVYDGDKKLGETKADQAGNYRFSLPTLAPGQHTLSTRVKDEKGNPIASSAPIRVTVSGGQAAQVAPTAVGAKPGAQAPTLTDLPQGTQWPSGMPAMLAGTAPPGSKVQLFANDKLSGETVTGQDGKWSLMQPSLPAGDHFLTTRAYGPNGALLGESAPAKVTVVGPGTPTVAVRPAAGQATAAVGVSVTRTAVVTSAAGTAPKTTVTASLATTATRVTTATLTGSAATAQAARPVFTGLKDGAQLPPGAPLAGTAAPGTKIRLFDGEKQIGETTAGADGRWSVALPALAAGAHALTASALGADGRVLGTSAPLNVTVGGTPGTTIQTVGTPGSAAVITGTLRPAGVVTGTPPVVQPAARITGTATMTGTGRPTGVITGTPQVARPAGAPGSTQPGATAAQPGATAAAATASAPGGAGVSLPAGEPIFLLGTADPGARLRIFSDNTQVGEAVADASGQWRLMLPALKTGTHELVARVFDAAGKQLSSSAPLTITIPGSSAPGAAVPTPGKGTPVAAGTPAAAATTAAPPVISGPLPGAEVPATSPGALAGKAEPGSTIRIYDGDALVAEIVVGQDGAWRVVLPQMAEGPHTFVVRVVSPEGSETNPSAPVLVVVRPAMITTPVPTTPGAAGSAARPSVSSPEAGGAVQASQPLLSGSAAPGSTVRIYAGTVPIGETKTDASGKWHFVPPTPLAIGKHALRVTSVGPDGVEAPAEVFEIIVAEGATGLKPLMFSASYGKAPSPFGLLQGTAPPGAIVVLYDGDVRVVKIPVDANGLWQYALPARTRLGQHQYRIVVTSPDGATIYQAGPVAVRIGAAPPPFLPRTGPAD